MARIYLAIAAGAANDFARRQLAKTVEAAGHVVEQDDVATLRECDGVIALLDGGDAEVAAATALAHGLGKPTIGLHSGAALGAVTKGCLDEVVDGDDLAELVAAVEPFCDRVRPFSGRLVRDQIPRLVREAGHAVTFRALSPDEKPRFLKRKIMEEAKELVAADLNDEREEIADVLEALEAFIRVRDFDRDSLKQVKHGKLRRRGGFERCFVVEATHEGAQLSAPEPEMPPAQPMAASPETAPAADHAPPARPVDPQDVAKPSAAQLLDQADEAPPAPPAAEDTASRGWAPALLRRATERKSKVLWQAEGADAPDEPQP